MNQIPPRLPDLDFSPKWHRLVHFLIDSFLGGLFGVAILQGIFLVAGETEFASNLEGWLAELQHHRRKRWLKLLMLLPYYLVFEVGFGFTPAKLLTRTTTVCADGSKPTRLRLLGRTLSRVIPIDWLSFAFEANGKGWHDSFSGSYVVPLASLAKRGSLPAA